MSRFYRLPIGCDDDECEGLRLNEHLPPSVARHPHLFQILKRVGRQISEILKVLLRALAGGKTPENVQYIKNGKIRKLSLIRNYIQIFRKTGNLSYPARHLCRFL